MLLNKHVKNIITIILEMIKPVNKKTENYITITEFSNITGIKNASIKTALLQKGYISSKFKTIPTRTAICKEVVKIRLYKHYKCRIIYNKRRKRFYEKNISLIIFYKYYTYLSEKSQFKLAFWREYFTYVNLVII